MKVLIFGSTGFIGNVLLEYLQQQGVEAKGISQSGKNGALKIDISKSAEFSKISFKPDVIINCAARIPKQGKTSKDPEFLQGMFNVNAVGAVNIANWAIQKGIKRIINCSTLVVVKKPWPNPLSEDYAAIPDGFHVGYCMSKLCQEQLMNECVRDSETKLLHVRLSAVYGIGMPEEGIIFTLLKKLQQNQVVQLTNAEQNTFDFINVKDVAKALNTLFSNNFESGVMNLASSHPTSLLDLTFLLKKLTHSNSEINNRNTNDYESYSNISIARLKDHIGSVYNEFISLEDGLQELIKTIQ